METLHRLSEQYESQYDRDLAAGNIRQYIYPWATIGEAIVLLYLLIPFRSKSFHKYGAIFAWGFNLLSSIYILRYCRCRSMAPAFGLGLIKAWSILWTSVILIVHDSKTGFRRIVKVGSSENEGALTRVMGDTIPEASTATEKPPLSEVRRRHQETSTQTRHHDLLAWESYPTSSLFQRLDWVIDLYTNFRGMTWNWRISGPPPIPEWVKHELEGASTTTSTRQGSIIGRDGTRMYLNLRDLLVTRAKTLVLGYFMVDVLKTFMMHDPYFLLGNRDLPPPSFLPNLVKKLPFLVQSYRLLISMGMMYAALHTVFDLGPLFFAGVLGPKLIGTRGEPWAYPDTYGAFSIILDKGLAGWWGGWWHQTFRFAFESTAKRITQELGFETTSRSSKILQLVIAFSLSGCLHACASFVQPGRTHPLSGAFLFFFLQSIGIITQMLLSQKLEQMGLVERAPKIIRQATNFAFAHLWLYFTGPLICDDFAAGGIWLFEPIPISPLRGLGLGVLGTGWWCWQGFPWINVWQQGRHWWQTGLVL